MSDKKPNGDTDDLNDLLDSEYTLQMVNRLLHLRLI